MLHLYDAFLVTHSVCLHCPNCCKPVKIDILFLTSGPLSHEDVVSLHLDSPVASCAVVLHVLLVSL